MGNPWVIMGLLTLAGLAFILMEVLTPSFGILGGLATLSLVAVVWMAYRVSFIAGTAVLVVLLALVPLYCVMLVRLLPRTGLGHKLFLDRADQGRGDSQPQARELEQMVGRVGQAESVLRPAGTVRIDNRRREAVAEGGYIAAGTAVEVVGYDGLNLIVRPAVEKPASGRA